MFGKAAEKVTKEVVESVETAWVEPKVSYKTLTICVGVAFVLGTTVARRPIIIVK